MDLIKLFINTILYPAMELLKGNRVRAKIKELKADEFSPRDKLLSRESDELTRLLITASASVPRYKALGITEDEIRDDPFKALQKFPITRKRDVQTEPESFMNAAFPKDKLIANSTGGSTGEPLKFFMNRDAAEYYESARYRGLSAYGITPASRCLMLWGSPIELNANQAAKYKRREKFLKNRKVIPAYDIKADKIADWVREIDSYKPEYLYGYSSALEAMAKLMREKDIKPKHKLKAIVSTSESLSEEQRKLISLTFGCRVVNEYGARDAGILAYECPCGEMHLIEENAYIEILDPVTYERLPDGNSGLVCVTDLENTAMIRLRYILGDMASVSGERCLCGRPTRVFSSIDGREDAMLIKKDNTLVHGHKINHFAKLRGTVRQFKFIQHSRDSATVYIVKNGDCSGFIDDIKETFPGMALEVEYVDEIKPEKSGKYRYTVREF